MWCGKAVMQRLRCRRLPSLATTSRASASAGIHHAAACPSRTVSRSSSAGCRRWLPDPRSRTAAASLHYSSGPSRSGSASPAERQEGREPQKPRRMSEAESTIWDKLKAEFSPTELSVQDISGGCGSLFGIEIASDKFRGVSVLKQQRMVNAVLGDEIKGWHGLQLRTKIPS